MRKIFQNEIHPQLALKTGNAIIFGTKQIISQMTFIKLFGLKNSQNLTIGLTKIKKGSTKKEIFNFKSQ